MTPGKTACLLRLPTILIAFLTFGCASIHSYRSADPHTITHHTWWTYYQRGRLYLKESKYAAARRDFETALGRVPGARYPYTQDRWRVRTYGLHMMEGYFPNRELGICLYYLNEDEDALNLLETSMSMMPSARAKFYINRIHEQLARAAAPPPVVEVASLPEWTSQRAVVVQGMVRGSNEVDRLSINGKPEFIELARNRISFRRKIELKEGPNPIQIQARDLTGKQTTTNLVVMVDWTPPQIYLHRNAQELSFDCRDDIGLLQVKINDHTVPVTGTEYTLIRPIKSDEPIHLTVSDLAGNTTDWSLSKRELHHLAERSKPGPPRIDLYQAGSTVTLFNPEFELDIRADDDAALRSVELNGRNLLTAATPLFRSLHRIPLTLGTNHVALAAEDQDGNRTEKALTVIYRKPAYLDSVYRLAAVQPPLTGEIPSPAFARQIDYLVGQQLTTPPIRFYLIANDAELQQLHSEQLLSESTFADPRAMLKQGRDLDADLILINRILSDAPGQTVYTQVLDAHSGEELFVEDVYLEDPAELRTQLQGLVMKIEQRFPLIQGRVLERQDGLAINAGEDQGAQQGLRLLVIRSNGSFDQGRVLQHENRPVEVVISKVERETSRIILSRGLPKDSALPGDYVFSR